MNHTCLIWTILIVTILFICWAEYSLGNVFLRSDCTGGKSFNFRSLLHLMTHPSTQQNTMEQTQYGFKLSVYNNNVTSWIFYFALIFL